MAKKSMLEREKKRELAVQKYAAKRQALKEAGRPHGYMRKFGICRNQFRDLAYNGDIPGIRKASW